jgi:nucleolar protein 6
LGGIDLRAIDTSEEGDDPSKKSAQLNTEGKRTKREDGTRERRKKIRGKDTGPKNLACRGFQPSQKSRSTVGEKEVIHSSHRTKQHSEEGEAVSDVESESSVEAVANSLTANESSGTSEETMKRQKKRRYLLFAGNLPQSASREEIVSHFERRGVRIAEFRLLSHKDTGKSRGCGFMEFCSEKDMQNALKFHRSRMQKKRINIEVTCGGGGKSDKRREKIAEKNRTLRRNKAIAKPFKKKKTSL